MTAQYRASYSGIREHILNAGFMVAHMRKIAERAQEIAESSAPVFEQGPHPGRYKEAFSTESGEGGGQKHDRAFGRLTNSAPEAFYVEVGTRNNPAHHTLRESITKAAAE